MSGKKSKSTFWILLKCLNHNQITLILRISNFERFFSNWVYVLWGDRNSKNHVQYKKKPTKLKMLRRRRLAFCINESKAHFFGWYSRRNVSDKIRQKSFLYIYTYIYIYILLYIIIIIIYILLYAIITIQSHTLYSYKTQLILDV